jgi:hypothetical protein
MRYIRDLLNLLSKNCRRTWRRLCRYVVSIKIADIKAAALFLFLFAFILVFITWAGVSGFVDQSMDFSEILGLDK